MPMNLEAASKRDSDGPNYPKKQHKSHRSQFRGQPGFRGNFPRRGTVEPHLTDEQIAKLLSKKITLDEYATFLRHYMSQLEASGLKEVEISITDDMDREDIEYLRKCNTALRTHGFSFQFSFVQQEQSKRPMAEEAVRSKSEEVERVIDQIRGMDVPQLRQDGFKLFDEITPFHKTIKDLHLLVIELGGQHVQLPPNTDPFWEKIDKLRDIYLRLVWEGICLSSNDEMVFARTDAFHGLRSFLDELAVICSYSKDESVRNRAIDFYMLSMGDPEAQSLQRDSKHFTGAKFARFKGIEVVLIPASQNELPITPPEGSDIPCIFASQKQRWQDKFKENFKGVVLNQQRPLKFILRDILYNRKIELRSPDAFKYFIVLIMKEVITDPDFITKQIDEFISGCGAKKRFGFFLPSKKPLQSQVDFFRNSYDNPLCQKAINKLLFFLEGALYTLSNNEHVYDKIIDKKESILERANAILEEVASLGQRYSHLTESESEKDYKRLHSILTPFDTLCQLQASLGKGSKLEDADILRKIRLCTRELERKLQSFHAYMQSSKHNEISPARVITIPKSSSTPAQRAKKQRKLVLKPNKIKISVSEDQISSVNFQLLIDEIKRHIRQSDTLDELKSKYTLSEIGDIDAEGLQTYDIHIDEELLFRFKANPTGGQHLRIYQPEILNAVSGSK